MPDGNAKGGRRTARERDQVDGDWVGTSWLMVFTSSSDLLKPWKLDGAFDGWSKKVCRRRKISWVGAWFLAASSVETAQHSLASHSATKHTRHWNPEWTQIIH